MLLKIYMYCKYDMCQWPFCSENCMVFINSFTPVHTCSKILTSCEIVGNSLLICRGKCLWFIGSFKLAKISDIHGMQRPAGTVHRKEHQTKCSPRWRDSIFHPRSPFRKLIIALYNSNFELFRLVLVSSLQTASWVQMHSTSRFFSDSLISERIWSIFQIQGSRQLSLLKEQL